MVTNNSKTQPETASALTNNTACEIIDIRQLCHVTGSLIVPFYISVFVGLFSFLTFSFTDQEFVSNCSCFFIIFWYCTMTYL